jgi:hypothetical protein
LDFRKIKIQLNNSVLPAFRTINFPSNFRFAKHYDDDDDDNDGGGGAVVMMWFNSI